MYKIVRFTFGEDSEVMQEGLTLEQAQEHCQRDDTHGEGWFDAYTEEGPSKPGTMTRVLVANREGL